MFIVYEGPDQSGKTTTRKLIEKIRDGKDVVIDRFIGSNIVYGVIDMRYFKEELKSLYIDDYRFASMFKPVLIYLYAPTEILIQRIKKEKHETIDEKKLKRTLLEYDKYFKRCGYDKKIKIDTSKYKQSEVVKQIINFLENVKIK